MCLFYRNFCIRSYTAARMTSAQRRKGPADYRSLSSIPSKKISHATKLITLCIRWFQPDSWPLGMLLRVEKMASISQPI